MPRFLEIDPAQFRIGDIVEVQITIATVPVQNNKYKMIAQLRCLALLDGTFTDVSFHPDQYDKELIPKKWKQATTNRSKASSCPTAIRPTIKRKVGYNVIDDEVAAAWEKMVNMNMNDRWYRYYLSIQRWKCWSKSLQWLGIVLLCLCDFNTARTIIIKTTETNNVWIKISMQEIQKRKCHSQI